MACVSTDPLKALSVMVVYERSRRFRFGQRQSILLTCRMGKGRGVGGGRGGKEGGVGRGGGGGGGGRRGV